jgi:hypothetical protein
MESTHSPEAPSQNNHGRRSVFWLTGGSTGGLPVRVGGRRAFRRRRCDTPAISHAFSSGKLGERTNR